MYGQEADILQPEEVMFEATAGEKPSVPEPSDPTAGEKRTFIPHSLEVTPFTPPPPPVVKRLSTVRVDAATRYISKNSSTITLQRGQASTEPDLPPPAPARPYVEPRDPTPEEISQHVWQHRHNFYLGATVYDHKISVVHWTDPESLARYEAVCGFDVGLLTGIGDFIHHGEKYHFFLLHTDIDTTSERGPSGQWQPDFPEVAPGKIHITQGNVKNAIATAPMTIIREIIAAETPRLLVYQAKQRAYSAASTAWHAANPPIARDETFILRPHRGSHYQSNAKLVKPARP